MVVFQEKPYLGHEYVLIGLNSVQHEKVAC